MSASGKFKISPVAKVTPFDNSTNGFVSTDSQAAIEEAKASGANASRGPTVCGFDGTGSSGRFLEFFSNNPSNTSPFVLAEPAQLIAISIVAAVATTCTVTILKNGVAATTITLATSRKNRVKNLAISFTDLDEISVSITSGSISRPTVYLFIRTLL